MKALVSRTGVAVCVLAAMAGVGASAAQAAPMQEPGAMLQDGTWTGDAGSYTVPQALATLRPAAWPTTQWVRFTVATDRIVATPMLAPEGEAPAFLRDIVAQLQSAQSGEAAQAQPLEQVESGSTAVMTPEVAVSEWLDAIYLRVPGTQWRGGVIPVYRFKNGTSSIRPQLDYRYALKLGEQEFAFTVRNGFRTKSGAPYGDGAQVTVEYDGQQYAYSLGEFGWDSTIVAIADLDGDGKPDFIFRVGGTNSETEAVLLSSKAKPGKNPATASLSSFGC